jgi:hypothetical protein
MNHSKKKILLSNLNYSKLKTINQTVLQKYGGKISGEMRESGCMISMIAVPFTMSEENSLKMGNDMFVDFGSEKKIEKNPHQNVPKKEPSKTPAQNYFAASLKLTKKKDFPLMNIKMGEIDYE